MQTILKWLEMRARAITPRPVKTVYRLFRSFEPVTIPKALPPNLVQGCRVVASRFELLKLMPKGGKVAELGTFKGDFARAILRTTEPSELHLIDIDDRPFDSTGLTGPSVQRHKGLTHQVVTRFPDGYFDWIYVDADHSYTGCLRDARAAAPKVRPGGYLVFNDFAHIDPDLGRYGVMAAVMNFAGENKWPLAVFALNVHGLHDVALQKPLS